MAEAVTDRKEKGSGAKRENYRYFKQSLVDLIFLFLSRQQKDTVESSGHIPCTSRDNFPLWAELGASTQSSDIHRQETPAPRQKK